MSIFFPTRDRVSLLEKQLDETHKANLNIISRVIKLIDSNTASIEILTKLSKSNSEAISSLAKSMSQK